MPETITFTKASVAAIEPSKRGYRYVYDSKQPGLAVSVGPNGPASFVAYRWGDGKPVRVTLGKVAALTVQEARKLAQEAAGEIAKGNDPTTEKRRLRASPTFAELFADYMEHHAKPRKRTWKEDQRKYDKHLAAPLARKKANAIKAADIRRLHNQLKDSSGPYLANRTLSLLKVVFNHARRQGVDLCNPCDGVRPFKEHQRARFMDAGELGKFMEAVRSEPDRDLRDIWGLLLWTAARKGNVLAMKWDALDLAGAVWRIPPSEAKGDDQLDVILPPPAVAILQQRLADRDDRRRQREARIAKARARGRNVERLQRTIENGKTYVFPSPSKTGHTVCIKFAWDRLLERAGIDGLHIHDLRRTAASWAVASGASLHVVGLALGHKDGDTTRVYARANLDTMRQAVETGVAAMQAAVANQNPTPRPDTPSTEDRQR